MALQYPNNLQAEREILGAILIDNHLIRKLTLPPEDFYAAKHGAIYKTMVELDVDGMPIDLSSLQEKGSDPVYASQIVAETITTANINYHADLVREAANTRKLMKVCMGIIEDAPTETFDNLLHRIRVATAGLTKGRGGKLVTTSEIAKNLSEFIDRRRKNRHDLSGVPSGFSDLDQLTDGFQGGDLIILAARPGQGKSALAMSFAENCGVPVGVISIEMGPHQIGIRTLSSLSQVELWRLRKGILSDDQNDVVTHSLAKLARLPIYYSFSSKKTVEIERAITQMIEVYECKLIIVDYLQLTQATEAKKREQEVAEVSRLLKSLAQSNNIPVIALSQLNREVEKRENKRPMLSDLRESGAIEQDADVVMFLYRPQTAEDGVIEVIIAKGRNIGLGTVKLYFKGDTMTFEQTERSAVN